MHRDRRITVVVETRYPDGRPDTCKFCLRPIVWFTRAARGGKSMPFNPHPLVLSLSEHHETHVKFYELSADSIHFVTCSNRPRKPAPRTGAR